MAATKEELIERLKGHGFKKGQSGNPAGRPVGCQNRSTIARKCLGLTTLEKNDITGTKELMTQEELMTYAVLKKAKKGEVNAYKELLNSAYGTPVQQIDAEVREQPLFPSRRKENDPE